MSQAMVAVLVLVALASGIESLSSRTLDESLQPPPPSGVQCTVCSSCNNPCTLQPPPPPPPRPHPPKKPKPPYCPPPPPPPFYIITGMPGTPGMPGELYPVAAGDRNFAVELPVLVGCGLLGFLVFWRW